MKKRSKQKAASRQKTHAQPSLSFAAQTIIRRARSFPIIECWISANWQEDDLGLVEVVIARQQPDNMICFGVYLVDKFCLGLKSTFARSNFSPSRYHSEVPGNIFQEMEATKCPIELAHQLIYASIDYAMRFGFTPDKDFALSQYLLAPRGELPEPYDLTFGQDGKPLFVAGPYDNARAILKQLEKTAGPGNYHYIMPLEGIEP